MPNCSRGFKGEGNEESFLRFPESSGKKKKKERKRENKKGDPPLSHDQLMNPPVKLSNNY